MFDEQVLWPSFVLSTRGTDGRESEGVSVWSSSLRTLLSATESAEWSESRTF